MSKKSDKKSAVASVTTANTPNRTWDLYWFFWGIAAILVTYLRLRLADMPLERDEGEYAYMGKLILDGIVPYKEAYNMKLPGTYFMYAIIELFFGKTYSGIHIGLWLLSLGSMLFLFLAFKKFFNGAVAATSAGLFGVMAVSMNFLGFAAHATHFVAFFAALGLWGMAQWTDKKTVLWAFFIGLFFGLSFLMKQQAVFFILFGGLWMLAVSYSYSKNALHTIAQSAAYSLGVFAPYLLVVAIMLAAGNFDKFWFWTFQYAQKYAAGATWEEGKMLFGMTFKPMWDEYMLVYLLSFLGLIMVWVSNYQLSAKLLATGFYLFAFLTVVPGFYFRQHYFIPWLPAVALSAALAIDVILQKVAKKNLSFIGFALVAIIVAVALNKNKIYYFKTKPERLCKMIYGSNPFTESVEIAKYIQANTDKNDKIAVLGSEPQIMVYANRQSATGHIYTYGLMEIHDYNKQMQQEMMAEIEAGKPKYIVYCNVRTSWLPRPGSVMDIFDWYATYVQQNYEVVGIADMVAPLQTNFYWDDEAKNYRPQAQEYLVIYKRKS